MSPITLRVERHQMSVGGRQQHFLVMERDGAARAIEQIVMIAASDRSQRPKSCRRVAAIRELFRNKLWVDIRGRRAYEVFGSVLTSALLVAGCSQVTDQFYSKKDFNAQSFHADISQCRKRNPSVVAMRVNAVESKAQVDDAMVRECMKAKGYIVQLETK